MNQTLTSLFFTELPERGDSGTSASTQYASLVPEITKLLIQHHQLYTNQCKAELWEEVCAIALRRCGFGSDWKPDFNHIPGVDQTTGNGVRIGNKGGKFKGKSKKLSLLSENLTTLTISGSRMTRFKTLNEKIEFLSDQKEDYIFCLATTEHWDYSHPVYYFIVLDSKDLDYVSGTWEEINGSRKSNKSSIVGYRYTGKNFTAKIQKSMSDQLWTMIDRSLFKEMHRIDIV